MKRCGGADHYFALPSDRQPGELVSCQCGLARLDPETGQATVRFPPPSCHWCGRPVEPGTRCVCGLYRPQERPEA